MPLGMSATAPDRPAVMYDEGGRLAFVIQALLAVGSKTIAKRADPARGVWRICTSSSSSWQLPVAEVLQPPSC